MNSLSWMKRCSGWQGRYRVRCSGDPTVGDAVDGITVAIPTWNGAHLLDGCLDRIYTQTLKPDRILVIDNASTDDTKRVLLNHPGVEHIVLPDNIGYAGASSVALELTTTRLLAVLNNDTQPHENWLESLDSGLRSDPDIAVAFPLSVDALGRIDSAGDIPTRAGFFYKRGFRRTVDHGWLIREATTLVLASGVGALYRVEALRDIGGWDRGFHSYLEDVDISLRLWMSDWDIAFVPDSVVLHEQGRTGDRVPASRAFLTSRNESIVIAKNYPLSTILTMIPFLMFYSFLSLCSRAVGGGLFPFLAGKCAFLLSLRAIYQARSRVRRCRRLNHRLLEGTWLRTWISLSIFGGRKAPNAS